VSLSNPVYNNKPAFDKLPEIIGTGTLTLYIKIPDEKIH
jgi:hypothetical protein